MFVASFIFYFAVVGIGASSGVPGVRHDSCTEIYSINYEFLIVQIFSLMLKSQVLHLLSFDILQAPHPVHDSHNCLSNVFGLRFCRTS